MLNYTQMTGISHVRFLGESVTLATGEPNPWMLIGQASLLLALLFIIDGGVNALRRGGHGRPLWLMISLFALIALGTTQAVLVFWEVIDLPMMITPLFLLTAIAMANELSSGLLRAERAEHEVVSKTARLTAEVARQTEALRRANAQALASSKGKSKFLSSASHELRAPLHDLLGYAQLLRFSVRDTGIGIPPDRQQVIFEPFRRLDRCDRAPGLGLGLAISQQIVRAMGGGFRCKADLRSHPVACSALSCGCRGPMWRARTQRRESTAPSSAIEGVRAPF